MSAMRLALWARRWTPSWSACEQPDGRFPDLDLETRSQTAGLFRVAMPVLVAAVRSQSQQSTTAPVSYCAATSEVN
jgi:hypothetical protein